MNEERSKILEMLAQGKITVSDAERLLDAVGGSESANSDMKPTKPKPRYLCVTAESEGDNVNVRVPLQLLRAGIQFTSLVPESAKEKINMELKEKGIGFDIFNMKPEMVDELINAMSELQVSANDKDGDRVRVFCE